MANPPSIYIPRVHNDSHAGTTYTCLSDFIKACFHKEDIGSVSRVDFVPIPGSKGKPSSFSKVFVHFNEWYNSHYSYEVSKLLTKECSHDKGISQEPPIKLMYNKTHYWILKLNKSHYTNKSKIGSLEKQVGELNEKLSTYKHLLDSATSQLSQLTTCDKPSDIEEGSYKRKRNTTFNN